MSRRIGVVWPRAQAATGAGAPRAPGASPEIDTYFDKVVKYVPADIVATEG